MFVSASHLRRGQPDIDGATGPLLSLLCVVGFVASAPAILIGFVPPSQFAAAAPAPTSGSS